MRELCLEVYVTLDVKFDTGLVLGIFLWRVLYNLLIDV